MDEHVATSGDSLSYEVNYPIKLWIDLSTWNVIDQNFNVLYSDVYPFWHGTQAQHVGDPTRLKKGLVLGCIYTTKPDPFLNSVHGITLHKYC
jgi:hypothetical protein